MIRISRRAFIARAIAVVGGATAYLALPIRALAYGAPYPVYQSTWLNYIGELDTLCTQKGNCTVLASNTGTGPLSALCTGVHCDFGHHLDCCMRLDAGDYGCKVYACICDNGNGYCGGYCDSG